LKNTGVRAYKGQTANLISSPDLLTAALQIHSEARHASEVQEDYAWTKRMDYAMIVADSI
jgi:hypothetical protein